MHDDYKVKPLHIMLPKTSAYIKRYDGKTKWIYFLINNDDLLEKYNTVWDKVNADVRKNLIVNLSIITFFENLIKSYGIEVRDFYDKEIPKGGL